MDPQQASEVKAQRDAAEEKQDAARAALEQLDTAPALEIDDAFKEFDADAVIRSLVPGILDEEPEALDILRNGANTRAEFQRLFAKLIDRQIGEQSTQWNSGQCAEESQGHGFHGKKISNLSARGPERTHHSDVVPSLGDRHRKCVVNKE